MEALEATHMLGVKAEAYHWCWRLSVQANQEPPVVCLPSKPRWQHVHLSSVRQASADVAAHGHRVPGASSSALMQLWGLKPALQLLVVLVSELQVLRDSLRGHSPAMVLQHSSFKCD